jgi:transposase-like protein
MGRTKNNMTRAARQLGITRRALGYRLRKYGLYRKEMDEGAVEEGTSEAAENDEYPEPESEDKDVEVE